MTSYTTLALNRYPNDNKMRKEYLMRLEQCKLQPAYHIQLPSGDLYPCLCEPLMEDDTKGWQVIQRRRYVKKIKTIQDLDEEADLNNWEDVEHYGGATYVNTSSYEHNGALFDIGSRF